ncbi:hypothetical protein EXIGLDRAFT_733468 [Exidia glandulosa HHB12029]|uniref:Uncharacterized protein n=1 Tax=Exidia glandulosa HHB12029 TaxID=1314781 RepID=A0A165KH26_EXIGL|nr:hypothetical protein EXIGLDRAFT_733468 [Exidia glandulosa HHB12029]
MRQTYINVFKTAEASCSLSRSRSSSQRCPTVATITANLSPRRTSRPPTAMPPNSRSALFTMRPPATSACSTTSRPSVHRRPGLRLGLARLQQEK